MMRKFHNFFDYEYAKYRAEELKLSQYKLADKLNTTQQCINNWFNGKVIPNLYFVVMIADLLKLPVQNLIKDVDE